MFENDSRSKIYILGCAKNTKEEKYMTLSKKVLKRSLAMFLTFAMIFVLIPQNAFASVGEIDTGYDDNKVLKLEPEVHLSDEYAKVATQADIDAIKQAAVDAGSRGLSKSTPVFEENQYDDMVAYVRQGLANRQTTITVSYKTTGNNSSFVSSAIEDAMKHTGVGNEGDYIERSFMSWATGNSSGYYSGSQVVWTVPYNINYYTTKAQEDVLATKIDEVLDSLNLDGKSDYEKFKLIYDYICANITYDNANLNNSSYYLKYTAYAALINKTAVCQGYACLLYRMLLDAGVDNRIITGLANGGGSTGGHAWNIVKPDAYWFYYVDSTWDATYKQAGRSYPYFLKSLDNFGNHYPGVTSMSGNQYQYEDRIVEILNSYPIAESNYVLCSHTWNNVLSVEKAATTSADGSKVVGCSKCIEKKLAVIKRIGNVSLSQTSYTYDGSAKKPVVTVTDRDGATIASSNYDVSYQNNVNAGTATAVVTFKNEYSGSVSRQFTISAGNDKPQINVEAADGRINVTWGAVSGATNYRVFTYLNGTYKKIAETTSCEYALTNLVNGTEYGVYVIAYINGTWKSSSKDYIKYATPSNGTSPIVKVVAGNGKINAGWNSVDGATKYRVFIYKDGVYTKKGDTTGTSYTVSGLTNGVEYGIYVIAYIDGGWRGTTNDYIRYATPSNGAAPIVTLAAGNEKITASWDAVDGATKYRVFTYKDGVYTKKGETTSTTYTLSGLTNGVEYGIYVIAYINNTWKGTSVNYVRYAVPSNGLSPIISLTAGNKKITAKWDSVDGATKYRVFIYKDGVYTKKGETLATNYTISGLTNGTEYGVYVIAYINGSWKGTSVNYIRYATPKA